MRDFLGVGLDQAPPDHSTTSRTRRLIALENASRYLYLSAAVPEDGRLGQREDDRHRRHDAGSERGLYVTHPFVPNLYEHMQKRGLRVQRHVPTHGDMKTQADFLKVLSAPDGAN